MKTGDTIILSNEGMSRLFIVVDIEENVGCPYVIYKLRNAGGIHLLYVKKGFALPAGDLDINGHIILFEDDVSTKDYYLAVHKDYVLPL